MAPHLLTGAYLDGGSQVLWEDGERVFRRGWRPHDNGKRAVLLVMPAAEHPSRSSLDRLTLPRRSPARWPTWHPSRPDG